MLHPNLLLVQVCISRPAPASKCNIFPVFSPPPPILYSMSVSRQTSVQAVIAPVYIDTCWVHLKDWIGLQLSSPMVVLCCQREHSNSTAQPTALQNVVLSSLQPAIAGNSLPRATTGKSAAGAGEGGEGREGLRA